MVQFTVRNYLERVQKTALKIVLGQSFKTYKNALNILNLEPLNERREVLCLNFARRTSRHSKLDKLFPLSKKLHSMETRNPKK